eukprot:m51a1_g4467 hypothetical protein (129) ;mRNA; r:229532-230549
MGLHDMYFWDVCHMESGKQTTLLQSGSVYWGYVEDEWTLVILLNLIIPVNISMKKQLAPQLVNGQQDQIIKGLEAARAKLKEKIATYKKEQLRVTNDLHEQHVLIATLKSQNEGLKEQLVLLKSEHAN